MSSERGGDETIFLVCYRSGRGKHVDRKGKERCWSGASATENAHVRLGHLANGRGEERTHPVSGFLIFTSGVSTPRNDTVISRLDPSMLNKTLYHERYPLACFVLSLVCPIQC